MFLASSGALYVMMQHHTSSMIFVIFVHFFFLHISLDILKHASIICLTNIVCWACDERLFDKGISRGWWSPWAISGLADHPTAGRKHFYRPMAGRLFVTMDWDIFFETIHMHMFQFDETFPLRGWGSTPSNPLIVSAILLEKSHRSWPVKYSLMDGFRDWGF